jgi:polyhydroxyalkanoate synthesis regulator phasin
MGKGTDGSGNPFPNEETAVATKRRRNSITRLIEDVVDDAKDLVDDVVDRAKDVEHDGRKAVRRVKDDDDRPSNRSRRNGSTSEIDDLKSALDDLTAKVERLAALQAEARKDKP